MENHKGNNMKTAMEANGKLQRRPLKGSKGDGENRKGYEWETAEPTSGKPQRTNGNSQSDQREFATGTNGKP